MTETTEARFDKLIELESAKHRQTMIIDSLRVQVSMLRACVLAADALRDDVMWKDHDRVCQHYDDARAKVEV